MKKSKYILFIFILFCFFSLSVEAATKKAILTGNEVRLRSGPGTNYSQIASLAIGSVYTLADETIYPSEKSCSEGWYKIIYGNTSGYVCSSYISVYTESDNHTTPQNNCETEMSNLGFPSSYWSGLCNLKEKHPNWNFKAIVTNLDWKTVVDKESQCGLSAVPTDNTDYIDSSCTNIFGGSFKPASQKAVAYYMDPRNWLDEKYMFQYSYLKYDSSSASSYEKGVNGIIGNTEFYKYHLSVGNNLSSITTDSGASANVSPIFLASRMLQELGSSTSLYNLYSGNHGYYNFFNYGVNDSCVKANGTTACGINYARTVGWDSPRKAIEGAAGLLAANYINRGQYTTYLQKFNVVPTQQSLLYGHQYMTNIAAPSSESKITYNSYKSIGILDIGHTFYIPVYQNMDDTIHNSNNGGSGEENNGPTSLPISTIVNSSGYKYASGIISGIKVGTDVSSIINTLQAMSGNPNVTITNGSGNKVTSGTIGTGFKVSISNGETTEELKVVIKGDVDGNGKIDARDLLFIQKDILKTYSLSDVAFKAADISGDEAITALDLLQVQKQILGTYTIEQ